MENPKNLADFLKSELPNLYKIFTNHPTPLVSYKVDNSPVTKLDHALSEYMESLFKTEYPDVTFYSEENFSEWKFPLIALDPLDGTREYVSGNPEWAISVGKFATERFEGEGWVYNPPKNELFDDAKARAFVSKETYRGEVSRSEWSKGLYRHLREEKFSIHPVGSIAYKLARLSKGDCDFVVSLLPKNIWDVAGGTLLCQKAGLKFYAGGKEVTSVQKIYRPPLIWCHPELFSELSALFA